MTFDYPTYYAMQETAYVHVRGAELWKKYVEEKYGRDNTEYRKAQAEFFATRSMYDDIFKANYYHDRDNKAFTLTDEQVLKY